MRALIDLHADARRWLERIATNAAVAAWPAHLYVEVGNGLVRLTRAGALDARRAERIASQVRLMRAYVHPAESVETAMGVALERHLTVYDAAYVVLAEALGAPLVTADRRLAEATDAAVLLPG